MGMSMLKMNAEPGLVNGIFLPYFRKYCNQKVIELFRY
ncbi:hypothetical protein ADICYQ_5027 [Cyclobacterium qasimii M12-11B]|uniref:Uncharacterized protein n=1 Tax=Cyclobacterium qasimii M12-11B TaxID=641524 RepID=S7V8J0_9BACT|nr:hypothetical protein ADICYQ_5027 [Cyclobacterium qasimii M12-11B]